MWGEMSEISQRAVLGAFARHGLSQAGADFVLMATDPFHDENYRIVGLPDQTSGRSYIASIRQEIPIEAHSSGSVWSAHVAFQPCVFANGDGSATITDGCTVDNLTGVVTSSGTVGWNGNGSVLVVSKQPDTTDSFDPTGAVPNEYQSIDIPQLVELGTRARLLGGGYEIHNTTEELHRSGQVTDYRVDSDACWTNLKCETSPGSAQYRIPSVLKGTLPPNSLAAAKQINGVTREAADGSMVVLCRDEHSHAAILPQRGFSILERHDTSSGPGVTDGFMSQAPYTDLGTEMGVVRELPFMTSGSYYSGLSPQTKLNLSVVFFVEIFPAPGRANMALAQPAPPYDPEALELLSYIQSGTLPGYAVSWNGLGKFTRWMHRRVKDAAKVVKGVTKFISPVAAIASGIPGPVGAIGSSVQAANMVARHAADALESNPTNAQKRARRRRKR